MSIPTHLVNLLAQYVETISTQDEQRWLFVRAVIASTAAARELLAE